METIDSTLNVSSLRRGREWSTPLRHCLRESGEIVRLSDVEATALQTLVDELRFPVYAQLVRGIALRFGTVCHRIHFDYMPSDTEGDNLDVSVLRLGDWNVGRVDVDIDVSDAAYARYLCGDRIAATSCGRRHISLPTTRDEAPSNAADAACPSPTSADVPPVAEQTNPSAMSSPRLVDAAHADQPADHGAAGRPLREDAHAEEPAGVSTLDKSRTEQEQEHGNAGFGEG